MSSFILSAKHYNSIEKGIEQVLKHSHFNSYELKPFGLYSYNVLPKQVPSIIEGYISNLRELNVLCVMLQYKHHYEGVLDEQIQVNLQEVKQKTDVKDLTALGLFNALKCIIYQTELEHLEGIRNLTEEEQKAFNFLETFINVLAKFICGELPEDETCKWTID